MPLHDATPPRQWTGAGDKSGWQAQLRSASYSGGTAGSPTLRYLHGRERVLGRRFWLHREPCIAASQLVEELGPLGARAWVRCLLEEVR